MKRITTVGLSLLAVLAFSAMASSSAFAGTFGKCEKVAKEGSGKTAKYTGGYTDKNCTEANAKKEGKYEFVAVKAGAKIAFTSKGKTATLSGGPDGSSITCLKNSDAGEITGPKSDVDVTKFEECTNSLTKEACLNTGTPGKKGGEIVTYPDVTTLIDHGEKGSGYKGEEPAEGKVWDQFTGTVTSKIDPLITDVLAEFVCLYKKTTEIPVIVTGAVSGEVEGANKVSKSGGTKFGTGGGEQAEETWTINPATEKLELFKTQQEAQDKVKYSEKIEIKS